MLLDMVSYCHHQQRLIPLMDAFPMECFLFSLSLHIQKFSPQPAEREKEISCSYSDSSCAFILLSLPSFSNAGQIYYSAIMRFTVYSVVKSPLALFASARQSVCQKRRAAAHYKELLYIASGVAFFVPRALSFFLSLSLRARCGIVFYPG
jgi:hypothetical protein